MENNLVAYADAQAVADGYLVPVPFGPFARVTRRVWDAYAAHTGSADRTMDALRQTWTRTLAIAPAPNGLRILRRRGRSVWLAPNELGGLTLMFPDDN